MKFCSKCGAKISNESAKFCSECGANLSIISAPTAEESSASTLLNEFEYEVMPDGTYAIIKPKEKYKSKYVIPEGVSTIREKAFSDSNASAIEEVVLPESIRVIEAKCFSECNSLQTINFPKNLEVIGNSAFKKTALTEIVFPENSRLRIIESYAFSYCNNLNTILLSERIETIEQYVFSHSKVAEITLPSSLRRIEAGAFSETEIAKIVFNEGIEVINSSSFYSAKISKIIFPNSLRRIGTGAFSEASISTVVFNEGVEVIEARAFSRAQLSEIVFPNSLQRIEENAFYKATIRKIIFNEGLKYIGKEAFREAGLPFTVYLPNSLTEVEGELFTSSHLVVYNGPIQKLGGDHIVLQRREAPAHTINRNSSNKSLDPTPTTSQGIYLGRTDKQNYAFEKIGDITYYFEHTYSSTTKKRLVGLECEHPIKHLELPSIGIGDVEIPYFESAHIECVTLPRDIDSYVKITCRDCMFHHKVKKLIIPVEVHEIHVESAIFDIFDLIEMESAKGWPNRFKKEIETPEKFRAYVKKHHAIHVKKGFLSGFSIYEMF